MIRVLIAAAFILVAQDDPIKEFEKRIQTEMEKIGGKPFQRVLLDGKVLFRGFGDAPDFKVIEEEAGRFLKGVRDGKDVLKVQLGDLGKGAELPPVVVDEPGKVSVDSKARSVNGVSSCEVTVNGKTVYKGPGSKVESKVSSDSKDGKSTQYAEVWVDGKVVYKAGQGVADPDPRRNKDHRYHGK